jgi:DNA primase catalytic core
MTKFITDLSGARSKLRKELDIVKVISDDLGPAVKTSGQDLFYCCHFHADNTPSFGVHRQLQIYKCFSCTRGGDVITWTQEYHGLTLPETIYFLAVKYGVDIAAFERQPTEEELAKIRFESICDKAASFCCEQLFQNKSLLEWYKTDTGFTVDQIADYEVGWNHSTDVLVRYLFSNVPQLTQDDVNKLEFTNRLMWDNALVYPIKNPSGKTIRFYNKPLTPPTDFGGKYIGTSHKHPLFTNKLLFGLNLVRQKLKDNKYSIRLVEGQKAAIAAGAVAMMGSSLHEEQIQLLQEYKVKEIIIAFDGDAAGRVASIRLLDDISLMGGVNVLLGRIPDDLQPDTVVKMFGKAALDVVFNEAVLPIEWYLNTKRDTSGIVPLKDKFAIIQELKGYLSSIPELHLDLTAKYLSDELNVDVASIKSFVMELKLTKSGLINKDTELSVLRHVLLNPKTWAIVRQAIIDVKTFTVGAHQYLFSALDSYHKKARLLSGPESVTIQAIRDELSVMFPQFKDLCAVIDTILTTEPKYEFMDSLSRIVDLYRRRTGIEQSRVFMAMMQDLGKPTGDTVQQFRRGLVSSLTVKKDDLGTPVLLAEAVQNEIRIRMANKSDIIGYNFSTLVDVDGEVIPCLTGLTYAFSGLQRGHQVVISAMSGVGKSILGLQIATSLAVCPKPQDQVPLLWIPLEMNEYELTFRIISLITGIDNNLVQMGRFTDEQFLKYQKAMDMIAGSQLYIKKPEIGSIDEIASIVDEYKFKYGIEGVILDYIQLVTPSAQDKGTARHEMWGRASKVLKHQIAENMKMFSISIAQLNRKDPGNLKQENIGGSYEVSQDADDHILLSERTEEQMNEEKGMKGNRRGFIDKRRGGTSDIMIDYELDDGRNQAKGRTLRCIERINPGQMMGLQGK